MADNYQIELTLDEIFGTGISSIEQTTVSTEPGGENIWTVTLTNGNAYSFTVFNGTAGGDPIPVKTASAMTDTSAVYLYLGTETGYTFGHWYYYDATWKDGGAYGAKGDKGEDGEDGADGFSPIATVTKSGPTTTISITDENGTTTAQVEDGVRPVVNAASTAGDMTDTDIIYVYVGETTASLTNGDWYFYDGEEWQDGGVYQSSVPVIDATLSNTGQAADAKKVGDEISDLKSQIANGGLKDTIKEALMGLANAVGYKNAEIGDSAKDALYHALYDVEILSIHASFDRGEGMIFTCDGLDSLRDKLTVTANYDDGTSGEVTTYTLSGTLTAGTSTITVEYLDKTTTFTVTDVTEGTDVTPALSSFVQGTYSKLEVNTANNTIRVYNTTNRTYQGVHTPFTMESGYTYKTYFDVDIASGIARAAYTDSNDSSVGAGYHSGTKTESGSYTFESEYSASVAQFFLYCTWGTATQGNATYSNLRIVKYVAEA